MTKRLEQTWKLLFGEDTGTLNYWVAKGLIPLGTKHHPDYYDNYETIPDSEIVCAPFDAVDMDDSKRQANNILILGGSGDGKTLLMKLIWSVFHEAGYRTIYFDPVGTESGRAKVAWKSDRLPPHIKPKGIPLKHYMPPWAIDEEMELLKHHFIQYSTRLKYIDQREMWKGLGLSEKGAIRLSQLIKNAVEEKGYIKFSEMEREVDVITKEELSAGSVDSVKRALTVLKEDRIVDESYDELDLRKVWDAGYAICISYNNASSALISFDVGLQIKKCARVNRRGDINRNGHRIPIVCLFDDPADYSGETEFGTFNFAVHQEHRIGINYRKLGISGVMAAQGLKMLNQKIADQFKSKIISPYFQNVDSLSTINIPKVAIDMIKDGDLVRDKKNHVVQFLYIDSNNDVTPFFPFTPPCGHFGEIYFEKSGDEKHAEVSEE